MEVEIRNSRRMTTVVEMPQDPTDITKENVNDCTFLDYEKRTIKHTAVEINGEYIPERNGNRNWTCLELLLLWIFFIVSGISAKDFAVQYTLDIIEKANCTGGPDCLERCQLEMGRYWAAYFLGILLCYLYSVIARIYALIGLPIFVAFLLKIAGIKNKKEDCSTGNNNNGSYTYSRIPPTETRNRILNLPSFKSRRKIVDLTMVHKIISKQCGLDPSSFYSFNNSDTRGGKRQLRNTVPKIKA